MVWLSNRFVGKGYWWVRPVCGAEVILAGEELVVDGEAGRARPTPTQSHSLGLRAVRGGASSSPAIGR